MCCEKLICIQCYRRRRGHFCTNKDFWKRWGGQAWLWKKDLSRKRCSEGPCRPEQGSLWAFISLCSGLQVSITCFIMGDTHGALWWRNNWTHWSWTRWLPLDFHTVDSTQGGKEITLLPAVKSPGEKDALGYQFQSLKEEWFIRDGWSRYRKNWEIHCYRLGMWTDQRENETNGRDFIKKKSRVGESWRRWVSGGESEDSGLSSGAYRT